MKRFYDVHCHTMTLSHPGILLFAIRALKELRVVPKDGGGWRRWWLLWVASGLLALQVALIVLRFISYSHPDYRIDQALLLILRIDLLIVLLAILVVLGLYHLLQQRHRHGELPPMLMFLFDHWPALQRVFNVLALMENDLGEQFVQMHRDLTKDQADEKLRINDRTYDRLVITPLIMDFGEAGRYPLPVVYRDFARKPVVNQVIDLFTGIKRYYAECEQPLLEIYPFLGINTRNYPLDGTGNAAGVKDLLAKYFADYHACPKCLSRTIPTFDGNIAAMGSNFFAGIKLYPPLGFDPLPADPDEARKTDYLFGFCAERHIPITFHCNTGGFQVADRREARRNADPRRWYDVLKKYPRLKIDFAHFGGNEIDPDTGRSWTEEIISFMKETEYPDVYADIAYIGNDPAYYPTLDTLLNENYILKERLLFGTDFSIVLLSTKSYAAYYAAFETAPNCRELAKMCNRNAKHFLFEPAKKRTCGH